MNNIKTITKQIKTELLTIRPGARVNSATIDKMVIYHLSMDNSILENDIKTSRLYIKQGNIYCSILEIINSCIACNSTPDLYYDEKRSRVYYNHTYCINSIIKTVIVSMDPLFNIENHTSAGYLLTSYYHLAMQKLWTARPDYKQQAAQRIKQIKYIDQLIA